ncbi:hypothetical protein TraAM80_09023, partial [Trypanosoma rangeli]
MAVWARVLVLACGGALWDSLRRSSVAASPKQVVSAMRRCSHSSRRRCAYSHLRGVVGGGWKGAGGVTAPSHLARGLWGAMARPPSHRDRLEVCLYAGERSSEEDIAPRPISPAGSYGAWGQCGRCRNTNHVVQA